MHKNVTIADLPAYHSYPDDGAMHPGLVLIHEIWGLDDHIKRVADRYAAEGYSVIAPNLFHGMSFEGKIDSQLFADMENPDKRDEAQKKMRELMGPIRSPEFAEATLKNLVACVDYLASDVGVTDRIGVLGFCFGGTYSFHLAAHDSRINAAVPFYGHAPAEEEVATITCPILAFYGVNDQPLIESLPQLKEDMEKHHVSFDAKVFPNTAHAFFNDTNARMYDAHAAREAWTMSLSFLQLHLHEEVAS